MRLSERKHKEVEGRLDIYKDMYKEERKKNTKVNVKTHSKYSDQENGNMTCHLAFVKARLKGRVISEAFFFLSFTYQRNCLQISSPSLSKALKSGRKKTQKHKNTNLMLFNIIMYFFS